MRAAVLLAMGRVAPQHEGIRLAIGQATIISAVCGLLGGATDAAAVKQVVRSEGDLGTAVARLLSGTRCALEPPSPPAGCRPRPRPHSP